MKTTLTQTLTLTATITLILTLKHTTQLALTQNWQKKYVHTNKALTYLLATTILTTLTILLHLK